ncbi:MAG: 6,7-dimethyl-8-ribityllumazine synthase [Candidatus Micrarchaeota archaeon]|nr:6,7-dimethyl-8-ribityllumazine synthase [Candidatus Micrarchaeota archaeon]
MAFNIAIVVSEFNDEITTPMLEAALERAKAIGLNVSSVSRVPGAYDMPLSVDLLLGRKDVDAVVTLGAIIKGDTKHDELIANVTAKTLTELSLKHRKPVALGISGPGMTHGQAEERIKPVAERAVDAAMHMLKETARIS